MSKEQIGKPSTAALLSADQLKPLLRECLEDEEMLNWLRKLLNAKTTDQRDSEAQAEVVRVQRMLRDQEAVLLQARSTLTQKDRELAQLNERLHQAEQRERDAKAQWEALRKQGSLPTEISALLGHVRADSRLVARFGLDIQADDVAIDVRRQPQVGLQDGFLYTFSAARVPGLDGEQVSPG